MFPFHMPLVILSCCFVFIKGDGKFWFVTDFHMDQNYSRIGNPMNLCHEDKTIFPDVGFYGNFLCDSPLSLLEATVKSMQKIQPDPDFVIWTGDNLPHTEAFDPEWGTVFKTIKNISSLLSSGFPNTPIFPSIGNHDTFPPNILLPNASSDGIYEKYLKEGGWDKFLSKNASLTFLQGGYYSEVIKPGLRLISLNTILWYTPNNYTKEMNDPAYQFKWLREVLKKCFTSKEKVYIIGHVPPGYYNRVNPGQKSDPTFHLRFLEMYLELLHQYSDIILGQMYGHLHMDTFQLFQFNTGVFKSSSIIASSVSPWHFLSKYNVSLPVNPSIRLMLYSKKDFSLLDYDQFYMNLTKANMNHTNLVQNNLYEPLYKFTHFYNVPDLSTESLAQVYEMLKNNDSWFKDFYRLLTAGKQTTVCGKYCKIAQLCSMSATNNDEYKECMNTVNKSSFLDKTSNLNTNLILTITITASIVFFLAMFIFYQRYWKQNCHKSSSQLEYVPYMNLQ